MNSLIDMDPGKANGVYAILQAQTVDEEVIKNPSLKKGIDEIFDWYKSLSINHHIESYLLCHKNTFIFRLAYEKYHTGSLFLFCYRMQ